MFTTRPELQGSVGMVASTHWLASAAGMALLDSGGNAFDAACAAGFTLQVVEPHLNGPGGDLPLLFAGPGSAPTVLCAQGTAPAGATERHFRELGLDLIPGSGLLAAAVPGAVTGWLTLLRDHGTATLREVTAAALHYAATGIPVLPQIARTIARVADLFRTEWPTSAAVFLDHGTWLRNETWARTLERLVTEAEAASSDREAQLEHAIASWTSGFVAAEIDAFVRTPLWDSSGERHAGVLTADDLASWRPSYEAADDARLPRLDGVQDRSLGPGSRVVAATGIARRFRPAARAPLTSSMRSPRRRSSPSRIVRRGTATPPTYRSRRC